MCSEASCASRAARWTSGRQSFVPSHLPGMLLGVSDLGEWEQGWRLGYFAVGVVVLFVVQGVGEEVVMA